MRFDVVDVNHNESLLLHYSPDTWTPSIRVLTLSRVRVNHDGKVQSPSPPDGQVTSQPWIVTDTKSILTKPRTKILSEQLRIPNLAPISVVVKTDMNRNDLRRSSDFEEEIHSYEHKLPDLQGSVIPVCYGLYRTQNVDGSATSFLVLSHCGTSLYIEDHANDSDEFKCQVIHKFMEIHKRGWKHCDLDGANVLLYQNELFITDLETVYPHNCQMSQRVVPNDVRPQDQLFGCGEICAIADMLKMWHTPYVTIFDRRYNSTGDFSDAKKLLLQYMEKKSLTVAEQSKFLQDVKGTRTRLAEWRIKYDKITDEDRFLDRKVIEEGWQHEHPRLEYRGIVPINEQTEGSLYKRRVATGRRCCLGNMSNPA